MHATCPQNFATMAAIKEGLVIKFKAGAPRRWLVQHVDGSPTFHTDPSRKACKGDVLGRGTVKVIHFWRSRKPAQQGPCWLL